MAAVVGVGLAYPLRTATQCLGGVAQPWRAVLIATKVGDAEVIAASYHAPPGGQLRDREAVPGRRVRVLAGRPARPCAVRSGGGPQLDRLAGEIDDRLTLAGLNPDR